MWGGAETAGRAAIGDGGQWHAARAMLPGGASAATAATPHRAHLHGHALLDQSIKVLEDAVLGLYWPCHAGLAAAAEVTRPNV